MNIKNLILKYALQNAIKFNGKASQGAIIGKVFSESPELKKKAKEISRQIQKIVKEVNSLKIEEQVLKLEKLAPELLKKKKKQEKKELPELKNTKKVIMRFEPSPSGALHIGHAYVLALNYAYCKKYKGKLILRIGDTNPANIYPDAYKLIEKDAKWLTKNAISKVVIQSDRLDIYYDYAEKLISMGKAYVCTCDPDSFRELISKKTTCPCRNLSVKEHLQRFDKMFGEYGEGDAVVRIKTDVAHKNPAMRDWPALRINEHEHPRTLNKYKVWPLMNFSVVVDDIELGVTHIIRAKDHADNAKRQEYIYNYLNKKIPQTIFVGRINFEDLKISASEIRKLIEYGKYTGWDDIRLPFLPALRRRGYQPEAFIRYALDVGISLNDKTTNEKEFFKSLNSFNKNIIDKKSNRYFFIQEPKETIIENSPKQEIKINLHPDFQKRGKRTFKTKDKFYITTEDYNELEESKLYRLMDCLNFKKIKNKLVFHSLDYTEYKEKGKKIIHWLPKEKSVDVEVLMPDNAKVEGFGENSLLKLKQGDIVQFERFGFVRLDKKDKNKLRFWFCHR